ncbi:hypothetical protein J1792_13700 [Streptomyces triculaminicus]|uniref:Uncharacterized protein n=1 Tax=Streptomyces triculaminicus TaxID=2816232 RepID=A0A939FN66_9ACTN|nr:hypothetical protein [Streptomyces triculaminicus]MBO0653794.1 hypothetical protein [Streptomyces triculaminicus]
MTHWAGSSQEGPVVVSRFDKDRIQVTPLGFAPEVLALPGQALDGSQLEKVSAGEKVTLLLMSPGDVCELTPLTADTASGERVPYNLSLDPARLDALRQLVAGTADRKTASVDPAAAIRIVAQK